jgi:hypothetical protein
MRVWSSVSEFQGQRYGNEMTSDEDILVEKNEKRTDEGNLQKGQEQAQWQYRFPEYQ